jgi:hypothetical protein
MLKDVVIATRLARAFGLEFGATDASRHGLTEEMRQGRGDDDYSSLFRQYFPAGLSLKSDQQVSNGEDDQPRFAGLDEEKASAAEPVPDMAAAESSPPVITEVEEPPAVAGPAPDEIKDEAVPVPATHSMATVVESDAQVKVPVEPPDKGERSGEPRGMWGGLWRRRTDD